MKDKQCSDTHNVPIAMALHNTSGKLHMAASMKGGQSGNNSKPTSNGGK